MRNTCDECGTVLKSSVALMSHRGSLPCELARTQRRMDRQGWASCTFMDAREVLDAAEIEHEDGPVAYEKGRFVKKDRRPVTSMGVTHRFLGVWCPAWAVPIVDCTASFTVRVRVLRWAAQQPDDDALKTTLALVFPNLETFAASLEAAEQDAEWPANC